MNWEKINGDIQLIFFKYHWIIHGALFLLAFIFLASFSIYFINMNFTFKEFADNPYQFCMKEILKNAIK